MAVELALNNEEETLEEDGIRGAMHRRSKLQMFIAAGCVTGIWAGVYLTRSKAVQQPPLLNANSIQGTWKFECKNSQSAVVSQKVDFHNGSVEGITKLKADTPDGTAHLPFPDQSIKSIKESGDGYLLTASWQGTYKIAGKHHITLSIGQSKNRVRATFNPKEHTITLDHDFLLIYPDKAVYSQTGKH